MKICGIPITGTEGDSATLSLGAVALPQPLPAAQVHAVEEGESRALCGVGTDDMHLWREKWPGTKFVDHARCPDCKRVMSPPR